MLGIHSLDHIPAIGGLHVLAMKNSKRILAVTKTKIAQITGKKFDMSIRKIITRVGTTAGLIALLVNPSAHAGDHSMGFLVTKVGIGDGGNLGGFAGLLYCFAAD